MKFDAVTEYVEVFNNNNQAAEVHIKVTSGDFWIDIVIEPETARELAAELVSLADNIEAE
jgi:hypothetical protein